MSSASPRPRERLARALRRRRVGRAALARQAAVYAQAYYREHRRLPQPAVLALLTQRRRAWTVVRGEIEHVTGIVAVLRGFRSLPSLLAIARKLVGRW